MRKLSLLKILVAIFLLIVITISAIWFKSEKSNSYTEPQEALFAIDKGLLLIPAYKLNKDSLFFFIKDKNNLGAAYVNEGLLGWKAGTLNLGPMNNKSNHYNLKDYQVQDERLIYGLIKDGNERLIKVNKNDAQIINLAMLPPNVIEEYQLEGLYIWYFESDTTLDGGELKLIDKNTGLVIDTAPLK